MSPITSVQGLASGIKWQDIIDELVQVDTKIQLDPVKAKAAANAKRLSAWSNYGSLSGTLVSAAKVLADGSAFGGLSVTAPNSATTGRALLSATTTSGAVPGTYNVQVLATATSQQLSGDVVKDATAALGISGQFMIGGKVVTLAAGDSLNALRDKINALNTGDAPTRVSASILHTGGANARLVLTSDVGGATGVDLRDVRANASDPSVLTKLGFINGTTTNVAPDGAARSASFASQTRKLAAMALGVSVYPAPASIKVNGVTITVDLESQSLSDIVALINAKTPNTASIETVTSEGGAESYRLRIAGTVTATADAGSQPILEVLGLKRGVTGAVPQTVSTANVLRDAADATATGTTLLSELTLADGTSAAVGDTFTIAGTKADGLTSVSFTKTIGATDTVEDLLDELSAAFSAPGRSVSASIVGGKIQLTDDAGGDSGLSFSLATDNAGGGTLAFGATSTTTIGRQRELVAGTDARLLVNGALVSRSSNTITDAIPGVTLTVQQAEVGTTIPVTVARDVTRAVQALQTFASAFNAIQSFVSSSTAAGGDLAFNGAVRQSFNSLKSALLGNVPGLSSGSAYKSAGAVGVALDKNGKLTVDATVLTAALKNNPDAVKALFQTNGVVSDSDFSYITAGAKAASGSYDVAITHAATRSIASGTAANFVYAGGDPSDTLTIGDTVSGKSGSISLLNGDTPTTIAERLNALFTAQGIRLTAATTNGVLSVTSTDYGSTPGITIGFSSNGPTADIAGKLGLTAGTTRTGTDVAGSFKMNGQTYAATGNGQILTGAADGPVAGLALRYAGTNDAATTHVDFAVGVAGMAARIADQLSATNGIVSQQTESLQSQIEALNRRQADVQSRLDARRKALTIQFTTMEAALSKIQSQGQWLTQQLNALQSSNK